MKVLSITGNLTKDAVIKTIGSKEYMSFDLAENQYNGPNKDETTNYFSVLSTKLAMTKHLRKGDGVTVNGGLSIRNVEAQGEYAARSFYDIFANEVDFGAKAKGNQGVQPAEGGDDFPAI